MAVKVASATADVLGMAAADRADAAVPTGRVVRPSTVLRPVVIGAGVLVIADAILGAVLGG